MPLVLSLVHEISRVILLIVTLILSRLSKLLSLRSSLINVLLLHLLVILELLKLLELKKLLVLLWRNKRIWLRSLIYRGWLHLWKNCWLNVALWLILRNILSPWLTASGCLILLLLRPQLILSLCKGLSLSLVHHHLQLHPLVLLIHMPKLLLRQVA